MRRLRRAQRRRHRPEAAGVHRHARHLQHRVRAHARVLGRPHVHGSSSRLLFFERTFELFGADVTYGVVFMLLLYALAWYVLTQTSSDATSTRWRQPRGGAADRHRHQPGPVQRLRDGRSDERARRDATRGPHRLGDPVPARQQRTSAASRSCSVAPASSAAAGASSER